MSRILRFVVVTGLIGLVGCGKAPKAQEAAPAPTQPAQLVPVQRTVTVVGANGVPMQKTVTDFVDVTAPVMPQGEPLRMLPKDASPPSAMPGQKLPSGGEKLRVRMLPKDASPPSAMPGQKLPSGGEKLRDRPKAKTEAEPIRRLPKSAGAYGSATEPAPVAATASRSRAPAFCSTPGTAKGGSKSPAARNGDKPS